MHRRPSWTVLALFALCIVGAALRGWNLADRPVWEDESYTWSDSQGPWLPLLLGLNDRHHGPLSHILVRLAMEVSSSSQPWVLRLPAFCCGILCIPAAWWLGRAAQGPALGLAAALLVAIDPNLVDQSHQARMYSMLMLATLCALRQAWSLLDSPCPGRQRRPWCILGLLLGLLMWINFGGLAVWLGVAAAGAWAVLRDVRRQGWASGRARLIGLAWAYGTALLVAARSLWIFSLMRHSGHAAAQVAAGQAAAQVAAAAAQLQGLGMAAPVAIGLSIAGLVLLGRRAPALSALLIGTALATLSLALASRFVHAVFAPRYLTLIQPALWLGWAALPACFPAGCWRRPLRAAALTGLLVLCAWQTWQTVELIQVGRWPEWEFFRLAARWIDQRRTPGDVVLVSPRQNYRCLARYYGLTDTADERLAETVTNRSTSTATRPADMPRRLWLIVNLNTDDAFYDLPRLFCWYCPGTQAIQHEQAVIAMRKTGLAVICLEPRSVQCWGYRPEQLQLEPLPEGDRLQTSGYRKRHDVSPRL